MRQIFLPITIGDTGNIEISLTSISKHLNKYNPNIYFDKIFIINLDTSPDRWLKIKTNLINNGIFNIERQEGVYLPRVNPFKYLDPALYLHFEAYGGKYSRDPNYILNAVGTNMAHYHIVQKAIKRNYQRILVLEDDSYITSSFNDQFREGLSSIPTSLPWDLIYLGFKKSSPQFKAHRVNSYLIQPFNKIRGAYGYALNRSCFSYLLNKHLYLGMEIDVFYEFVMMKKRRVFAFYPQLIGHRDKMVSTITHQNWKSR